MCFVKLLFNKSNCFYCITNFSFSSPNHSFSNQFLYSPTSFPIGFSLYSYNNDYLFTILCFPCFFWFNFSTSFSSNQTAYSTLPQIVLNWLVLPPSNIHPMTTRAMVSLFNLKGIILPNYLPPCQLNHLAMRSLMRVFNDKKL